MKIAYVYPHFKNFGGTERVLIDKMNYFANQDGYEVYAVTHEQDNFPMAYELSSNVKHIDLGLCYGPLFLYCRIKRLYKVWKYDKLLKNRYNRLMEMLRPDIVIASTYFNHLISIVGYCKLPYVRILESHIDKRHLLNNDPFNRKNLYRWLYSFYLMKNITHTARRYDLLIALNDDDKKDWTKYVKTIIMPNMVHLNPTGKYSDYTSKRVIFAGRYTEQKGVEDLFKVWQLVYKKHPDWKLDLYGQGSLYNQLLLEARGLNINIDVHKPCDKIFDKFVDSSIFVLCSVFESFGLVMPEAMSCGLPIVVFDCPDGPRKIIDDGKTGFLVPNRDVSLFADKVCQLIESYDLRKKMGEAAIISSQRYSIDIIMPMWKDLFEKLTKPVVS